MADRDVLREWLAKRDSKKSREIVVNPFEGPDNRMDDPNQTMKPKYDVRTQGRDPVTVIYTIPPAQFKKITGEEPAGIGEVVRVMSPGLTTQPLISIDKVDVQAANGPKIRVIEGGAGIPESQPFINPWTSTNPLSTSSLLAPGQADSKGFSTTNNYDELRRRMGNHMVNLNGESMDILLPVDVTEMYSGTGVSIGGVPGRATIRSGENGFYSDKPIGQVRATKPLHWDGNEDGSR